MKTSERDVQGASWREVVELAAADLCRVRHLQKESLVNVPVFYSSGAGATVQVEPEGDHFLVTDLSRAYREASLVGADMGFMRSARSTAEKYGIKVADLAFVARCSAAHLSAAISDVAIASVEAAGKVVGSARSRSEQDIAAFIYERLVKLFGAKHVDHDQKFVGASGREWDMTAVVKVGSRPAAFKAVSTNAPSVYYSSTALRDIALLAEPPRLVCVIERVSSMGNLYNVLSQAGDVLEESASNNEWRRVAEAA